MVMENAKKRRPKYKPTLTDPPAMRMTSRDVGLLKVVNYHRFLTLPQIARLFSSTSQKKISRRLYLLFHNGYLARPEFQRFDHHSGGSSSAIHAITNKGRQYLARECDTRFKRIKNNTHRFFVDHTLKTSDVMIAFETSCQNQTLNLIYHDEVERRASSSIKKQPNLLTWPTPLSWRFQDVTMWIEPDKIFGLQSKRLPATWFFLEVDAGTMPVARKVLFRTSFLRKHLSYAVTYRDKLAHRNYGMKNFRVLTVTTSHERISNMIKAQNENTKDTCPQGLFLYTTFDDVKKSEDILTLKWRNGNGKEVSLLG